MNKNICICNKGKIKLEIGDIIYSQTTNFKVNKLVVTYVDDNNIGASTLLTLAKKSNWRQNNIIVLKETDEYVYALKIYIMKISAFKFYNWIVLNKQINENMIVDPQLVKKGRVIFDYFNSNSKLKFEVEQSKLQQNLKHKLEGVVEHKDIKLFTYVKLKKY